MWRRPGRGSAWAEWSRGPPGLIGDLAILPASHSQPRAAPVGLTVLQRGGEGPPVGRRPVRGTSGRDGVIEDLVLVRRAGHAVLAGRAAVVFPGSQDELVSP